MVNYFYEFTDEDNTLFANDSFRMNYNYNSGGGQAFLAGKWVDGDGNLRAAIELNGYEATFCFTINNGAGRTLIKLNDSEATYLIKPRAQQSSSMKLSVENRTNPGRILASFLMLPPPCTVRRPLDLSSSILTESNFWIQTVDFEVQNESDAAHTLDLLCTQVIVSGGISGKTNPKQRQRFFGVDLNSRFQDIIELATFESFPVEIEQDLAYFSGMYKGEHSYDYYTASSRVSSLMKELARLVPEHYSGTQDPLTGLQYLRDSICGEDVSAYGDVAGANRDFAPNRIVFGAPGTGKSYLLDIDRHRLLTDGGFYELLQQPSNINNRALPAHVCF